MFGKSSYIAKGRFPFVVIALFLFIVFSCAKQGFPPGGTLDVTSPELKKSIPEANSTNFPAAGQIQFEFSEAMDQDSVEENLFIVPIPVSWPKFEWRSGNRILSLKPAHQLDDNTTYVVTIGANARDQRNNALKESIIICFSTGSILENKIITGNVIPYNYLKDNKEKVSAVDIISYRLDDSAANPDPRNDIPDYFTQTGSDGSYEIVGLSGGQYRIFAVGDNDKDGFYTEDYDMIGVMSHDITLSESDSVLVAPDMMISMKYVTDIELTSIRVLYRQLVDLYFNRNINPKSMQIEFDDLNVLGLYIDNENPKLLHVATGVQKTGKRYGISKLNVSDIDGNILKQFENEPFFTGTDRPDTTSLAIEEQKPEILSTLNEEITLVFSRMLDLSQNTDGFLEFDSENAVTVSKISENTFKINPVDSWKNGYDYTILFDTEKVKGIEGNGLTDEESKLFFRVAPSDTLGFMKGNIEDFSVNSDSEYNLFLKNIETEDVKIIENKNKGEWNSGPILPGSYVCMAYRDDNGDDEIYRGSVNPYSYSEQAAVYPDTVYVEPRWTVSDINFIFR